MMIFSTFFALLPYKYHLMLASMNSSIMTAQL